MFEYIKNNLDYIYNNIINSPNIFIYLPLFMFILGFFSLSTPIGVFIPIAIIAMTVFAFCISNYYLFAIVFLLLFLGNFLGILFGYFLGKKYCNGFVCKIGDKYQSVEFAFKEIEKYIAKYNYLAIPLLVNIAFVKPFVGMYLGSRNYDFKKFLRGSLLASFIYTVIKAAIGALLGIFGKIIFDYLQIGYKYLIYGFIVLIIISFILDFIAVEKEKK